MKKSSILKNRKSQNSKELLIIPQKRASSIEEDNSLKKIAKILTQKIEEEKKDLSEIPFILDTKTFNLILYALQKKQKNENDIIFISHYLTSFKTILDLIDKKKILVDSSKILSEISTSIKLEKKRNKELICRYGDSGDKFYLILKGNVSVIIKKEIKIEMTEYEYYSYLLNLKNYSEFELIEDNLKMNNLIFDPIDMKDYINNVIEYEIPFDEKIIQYPNIDYEKLNKCSYNDYINRILPIVNADTEKSKKKINLFVYFKVINLKENQTFGDIALSGNFKRTATIICNEDCIFGFLTKNTYDNCIKGALEKIRFNNISFLINSELFFGVKSDTFVKKYFNFFTIIHLNQGNFLFKQGDKRKEIYILKEGLIEINIKCSYNELIRIINSKGEKIDENLEKRELKKKNLPLGNLLYLPKFFRVIKLGTNEIIGLDDYIDKNNCFFCNAICRSSFLEIFSIDYKIFTDIYQRDWRINQNVINYNKTRSNILFDRIILIRNIALNKDLIKIKNQSDAQIKEMEIRNSSTNKNTILSNTVYSSTKNFKNLIKQAIHKNNNKMRFFLNTHRKNNSTLDNNNITNNNFFSSEENTNENTIQLTDKEKQKTRKKIKSLNSLSNSNSNTSIKKLKNNIIINDMKKILNRELITKRILIPIKPSFINEHSQKKLKEFKMNLISSTTIVHSQEKEKDLIDKIFRRALYKKKESVTENQIKKTHKKIKSIDPVDFLILDKEMENYIPKKKKFTFDIKPLRLPLNYKNHSPFFRRNTTRILFDRDNE